MSSSRATRVCASPPERSAQTPATRGAVPRLSMTRPRAWWTRPFLFALYTRRVGRRGRRQVDRGVEHEGGSFPLGKGSRAESFDDYRSHPSWGAEGQRSGPLRTEPRAGRTSRGRGFDPFWRSGARGDLCPELSPEATRMRTSLLGASRAGGSHDKRLARTEQLALEHDGMSAYWRPSREHEPTRSDRRWHGARSCDSTGRSRVLRLDSASLVLGQHSSGKVEQWPVTAREIAAGSFRHRWPFARTNVDNRRRASLRRTACAERGRVALRSSKAPAGGVVVLGHTSQRDLERAPHIVPRDGVHDIGTRSAKIALLGDVAEHEPRACRGL